MNKEQKPQGTEPRRPEARNQEVKDKKLPENSKENLDEKLDEAVEETFPASDPISVRITK